MLLVNWFPMLLFSCSMVPSQLHYVGGKKPSNKHCHHQVQFYEQSEFLCRSVSRFAIAGLGAGEGVSIIATASHTALIREELERSIHFKAAVNTKQLIILDADEALSKLIVNGNPDPDRLYDTIGTLIDSQLAQFPRVRVYGEMVNILWHQKNVDGTIALEKIWNDFLRPRLVTLLCGYAIGM